MLKLTGTVRTIIYESSDSTYKVGLFKIKSISGDENLELGKVITFTGNFVSLNVDENLELEGEFIRHKRYGEQFQVSDYHKPEISGTDAILDFLQSPLVKNCGEKTALAIVNKFGEETLDKIKENPANLLQVEGISEKRAADIYYSVISYDEKDKLIVELKNMGFSITEAMKLIKEYGDNTLNVVKENLYVCKDIIDFKRLDSIYINFFNDKESEVRVLACLEESINKYNFDTGNIYLSKELLKEAINKYFAIYLEDDALDSYTEKLVKQNKIVIEEGNYYLKSYYDMEWYIANYLYTVDNEPIAEIKNLDREIELFQKDNNIYYDEKQIKAIKNALKSRISIITGGPGTGKTTIVNAIVKIYIEINKLHGKDLLDTVALLAPTGRASKRMSEFTHLPAYTIHKYLKWNKETNDFQINEDNKNYHRLIIIDETSMIDTYLLASLLKGLTYNTQIVFVGDVHQLCSVGPGNVLADLIDSDMFNYTPLEHIYRQSDNSYIPILAKEIKDKEIDPNFTTKMDDYNFLEVNKEAIKTTITEIVKKSKEKGLKMSDIQVLAPMYKGENGIDILNKTLQEILNPLELQKEITIGDVTFREKDKVLQLVNDPDNGVFNGDIGYIEEIRKKANSEEIVINFLDNKVIYKRSDMVNVKHAYAISIHKSQGSEFPHVILPMTISYYRMLYNKLLYTAVSRAKKSLIIVGERKAFLLGVNNDYSKDRVTTLKTRITYNYTNK